MMDEPGSVQRITIFIDSPSASNSGQGTIHDELVATDEEHDLPQMDSSSGRTATVQGLCCTGSPTKCGVHMVDEPGSVQRITFLVDSPSATSSESGAAQDTSVKLAATDEEHDVPQLRVSSDSTERSEPRAVQEMSIKLVATDEEHHLHQLHVSSGGTATEQGTHPCEPEQSGNSSLVQRSTERRQALEGTRSVKLLESANGERPWMIYARILLFIIAAVGSVAMSVSVLRTSKLDLHSKSEHFRYYSIMLCTHVAVTLIATIAFMVSLASAVTFLFRFVAAFMFLALLQVGSRTIIMWNLLNFSTSIVYRWVLTIFSWFSGLCLVILRSVLIFFWIQATQLSSQGTIRRHVRMDLYLKWMIASIVGFFVGSMLLLAYMRYRSDAYMLLGIVFCIISVNMICALVAFNWVSFNYFFRVWRIATAVQKVAEGKTREEAWDVSKTALVQLIGIAWSCTSMFVWMAVVVGIPTLGLSVVWRTLGLVGLFDGVSQVITGLALSGAFTGSFAGEVIRTSLDRQRSRLQASIRKAWRPSPNAAWHGMLETLADRAFTLDALLTFYKGKSVYCEMNKFDEMLAFMGVASNLEQVVAVDDGFNLFSRAWCVAELAVAAEMGIPQNVKVHSRGMLDKHMEKLSKMRIEEMEASRPEDKEEILRKIHDKEAFNRKLHSLVTERLFPSWRTLSRTAQMRRVGSLARWHSASTTPRLERLWQAMAVT